MMYFSIILFFVSDPIKVKITLLDKKNVKIFLSFLMLDKIFIEKNKRFTKFKLFCLSKTH